MLSHGTISQCYVVPGYGTSWYPELTMQPGHGYMYYTVETTPKSFYYPNPPRSSSPAKAMRNPVARHFEFTYNDYPFNKLVNSVVIIDGKESKNTMIEVGVVCGTEVRGSRFLEPVPHPFSLFTDERHCVPITVYGRTTEEPQHVIFKLYDHEKGREYNATHAPYEWNLASPGTGDVIDDPWQITLIPNFDIITSVAPTGEVGTITGNNTKMIHDIDTDLILTAIPAEGYEFVNWTEDGIVISTNPELTLTVTENRNLVANFDVATIPVVTPTGITVLPKTLSIDRGETYTLKADLKPVNANPAVTWSSSNTAIATVSATGVVTTHAAGKATITAKTINNLSATCGVTVTVPVESIVVDPPTWTLPLKGVKALKATVFPADATNKTITWSSSNTNIATVSTSGTVTAKSLNGTVEIYATNAASGIVGVCYITVGTGKSIAVETGGDMDDIVVYPNPTDGELKIEMCDMRYEICDIAIYDVMGRMVATVETGRAPSLQPIAPSTASLGVASTLRLDISHLPSGIYFIRIQTENGMVTRKVVKN